MITREQAKIGKRVKSNVDFSGVPAGTEGVIDEDYGSGVMVAWDLPNQPLPKGYEIWDGSPAFMTGLLRDGFGNDELHFLDLVAIPENPNQLKFNFN
jgi:hypothetical protein